MQIKKEKTEGRGETRTNSHADPTSKRPASDHRNARTNSMPTNRTSSDPPIILTSRHSNRSNLTAIAPLAQERHNERLDPSRAEQQAEQVSHTVESAGDIVAPARARRPRIVAVRRALWRLGQVGCGGCAGGAAAAAGFERVGGQRGAAPTAQFPHLVLLLLELGLDLLHFLADAGVFGHCEALAQHFGAEDEEEDGGEEGGEAFGEEGREGVAEDGGEDGHGDEGGEGGGEDDEAVVAHCH